MARSWRSTCAPHPRPALRPLADCLTAPGVAASAFLQCYTKSLVWPALFGLLATILQIADRQTSPNGNPLTDPFAIFLPMWGAFFLARWTRTERLLALRWGTEGASSEAPERREFKGEKEPIRTLDGKVTLTVKTKERGPDGWFVVSFVVLLLLVAGAMSCCVAALYMKAYSNTVCGNQTAVDRRDTMSAYVTEGPDGRFFNVSWSQPLPGQSGNTTVAVSLPATGAYSWALAARNDSLFGVNGIGGGECGPQLVGRTVLDLSALLGNFSAPPRTRNPSRAPRSAQFSIRADPLWVQHGRDGYTFVFKSKSFRACAAGSWSERPPDDNFFGFCPEHWYWLVGGSVFNLATLTAFSLVYLAVARRLTELENWRTEHEFNDALIVKNAVFEGLNNFFLLMYIAFFKRGTLFGQKNTCVLVKNPGVTDCELREDGVCLAPDCLFEMQIQLLVVFVVKTHGKQVWEFCSPFLFWAIETLLTLKSLEKVVGGGGGGGGDPESPAEAPKAVELSAVEKAAAMPAFGGTQNEFGTLMIQFGVVVFFSTALPIAPLLACIGNIIELRGDAWKVCHAVRRPAVVGSAEGIGTHYLVFQALVAISVVINALIMGFSMTVVAEWFYPGGGVGESVAERMQVGKLWVCVVVIEHAMVAGVVAIRAVVPAEPLWLEGARLRRRLYIERVVEVDVEAMFAEIDEDGSGALDAEELCVLCQRLSGDGAAPGGGTPEELMAQMTGGAGATVALEQFKRWWRSEMEPRSGEAR